MPEEPEVQPDPTGKTIQLIILVIVIPVILLCFAHTQWNSQSGIDKASVEISHLQDEIKELLAQKITMKEKNEDLEEINKKLELQKLELEMAVKREIDRLVASTDYQKIRNPPSPLDTERSFSWTGAIIFIILIFLFWLQIFEYHRVKDLLEIVCELSKFSSKMENLHPELVEHSSVLLLGGWDVVIEKYVLFYDSKKKLWFNSFLQLPQSIQGHGAAMLNGEIYIFGGSFGSEVPINPNHITSNCYRLEKDRSWMKMANMNEKRAFFSRNSIIFGGEIWVIGGTNGVNILKSVEKYNPLTNSWTQMAEMNSPRAHAATSIIAGKIYVSGGWDGFKRHKSIEVYDPSKNKWKLFCEMPLAVDVHSSAVDGTNLIIIGGRTTEANDCTNEVWKIDVLDPRKEWIKMRNLNHARYNHGSLKLGDKLMVIGGGNSPLIRVNTVEEFNGENWVECNLPFLNAGCAYIPLTKREEKIFILKHDFP